MFTSTGEHDHPKMIPLGTSIDVPPAIHPQWQHLAVILARALGRVEEVQQYERAETRVRMRTVLQIVAQTRP